MSEHVTALPEATQKAAPEAPAAAHGRRELYDKLKAIVLGAGFPVLFVLFWHYAVIVTGTRLKIGRAHV